MNKTQFLKIYRNPSSLLITTWFNDAKFQTDDNIKIETRKISLTEALDLYLTRYIKKGKRDTRPFEEQVYDEACIPIKIGEAILDLKLWNVENANHPPIGELWSIPIAKDTSSGKSLVIDSSHTICSIIANHKDEPMLVLPIIEILGPDLRGLVGDFKILNRQ